MNKLFSLSLIFCSLFLFACSDNEVAGGTEAESTIAVQIQLANGTPAANARVRMLPKSYLSDGIATAEWSNANESGVAEFTAKIGEYLIEARNIANEKALGAVANVVLDGNSRADKDTLSMDELSRIEGFVVAGQGPSVVRIPGMERFVVPDSSGHFVLDSIPPGSFEVYVESRSNRGNVSVQASSGDSIPTVDLGSPRGFVLENFETFSGKTATGEILGDGWWYSEDAAGEKLLPLLDSAMLRSFSGNEECASGGCVRTNQRIGFMLGEWNKNYDLSELNALKFSARGEGVLHVALVGDSESGEFGLETEVILSKVWQAYSIPVADMKPFGAASGMLKFSRVDFKTKSSGTLYLDDVLLDGIDESSLKNITTTKRKVSTEYPDGDWSKHDELLKEIEGYGVGTRGGAGADENSHGEICIVTTTDDYIVQGDSTIVAPGSLRDCATRDTATWVLFAKDGTYNLEGALRIKSYKTIDGRGRNVRITGMGIRTEVTSHLIFENVTFAVPAITAQDTSSRRALSIHNETNFVWVDHCTFEEYPLYEMDIKRGSHNVTISWSRFVNAQTGILFGLEPDLFVDTAQTVTLHHNLFMNLSRSGFYARRGKLHAYDNLFMNLGASGFDCTDSALCVVENNVFNVENSANLYRLFDEDGIPVDSTLGYVAMKGNWFIQDGSELLGDARGFKPDYVYSKDAADAGLTLKIMDFCGPR